MRSSLQHFRHAMTDAVSFICLNSLTGPKPKVVRIVDLDTVGKGPGAAFWAHDLVRAICDKSVDQAGQTCRNLKDNVFPSDKWLIVQHQSLNGNRPTRLIRAKDAIPLVLVLPGLFSTNDARYE